MEIHYASSFLRVYKKLIVPVKEGVKATTKDIINYYATGHKTLGLGIRHLQGDIWEGRTGLSVRIIYSLAGNRIRFLLAGTHNDVHNFLKHR